MKRRLKKYFWINNIYLLPYIIVSIGRFITGDTYWWIRGTGLSLWLLPGMFLRFFFLPYILTGILCLLAVVILLKEIRTAGNCKKDAVCFAGLAGGSILGLWSMETVFWAMMGI